MAGPSKGSKPDKILRDALILELNREMDGGDGQKIKKVNRVVHKLVDAAVEGKLDAIKEVWDRVEGKAPQSITSDSTVSISFEGLAEQFDAKLGGILERARGERAQGRTH